MKRFYSIMVLFLIAFSFNAHAITVEQIVEKVKKATGHANTKKTKNIQYEISIKMMNMPMNMTMKMVLPDKLRVETSGMGQEMVVVLNGDKGWMSRAGELVDLPKDAMDEQKSRVEMAGILTTKLLTDYKEKGYKLTLLGQEKVNEKPAYKILITLPKGDPITFFVDKKNFKMVKLQLKQKAMGQLMEFEYVYKEFKKINGSLYPVSWDVFVGGQPMGEARAKNIKINKKIDPKIFEKKITK